MLRSSRFRFLLVASLSFSATQLGFSDYDQNKLDKIFTSMSNLGSKQSVANKALHERVSEVVYASADLSANQRKKFTQELAIFQSNILKGAIPYTKIGGEDKWKDLFAEASEKHLIEQMECETIKAKKMGKNKFFDKIEKREELNVSLFLT